jgi:hypothetical protein
VAAVFKISGVEAIKSPTAGAPNAAKIKVKP